MTVTIQLPPDIEADLVAQARDHGLELPLYVESTLRRQVSPRPDSPITAAERASDDAISRESISRNDGK
jgi:hypothetical protein